MKLFLNKILIFSILLLGLSVVLDLVISFGLRSIDSYRYEVMDDIMDGEMKHDLLIMGNSRGFSHFNTAILDSICGVDSYNIGVGGCPVNVQIAMYNCYKQHNAVPKIIVQEASFGTLENMSDIRHQHDSERFFPAVYDKAMRKELHNIGYDALELWCPLYRYFGYQKVIKDGILEFLHVKHGVDRPTYKGFSSETGAWDGTEAEKIDSISASMENKVIFEKYLEECKNNGVYVLLVNSPVYYETTAKVVNMKELNDYFSSVAEKYGFKYLNYTENYSLCNDTSNFCVSVHLNSQATDKFSEDFAKELQFLGVLN